MLNSASGSTGLLRWAFSPACRLRCTSSPGKMWQPSGLTFLHAWVILVDHAAPLDRHPDLPARVGDPALAQGVFEFIRHRAGKKRLGHKAVHTLAAPGGKMDRCFILSYFPALRQWF